MTIVGSTLVAETTAASGMLETLLLASTEHAIVATDLSGRIILWNEGARRLFGYTAEEAIGHNVLEFDPVGGIPRSMIEEIVVLVHAGAVWEGSVPGVRADGSEVHVRVTVTALREAGVVSGFLIVSRDTTLELGELSMRIRELMGAVVADRGGRVAVDIPDETIQMLAALLQT